MNRSLILILLTIHSFGWQLYAQDIQEKNSMLIKENHISKLKYDKFWNILKKNHITYHPKEQWVVVSDTLAYVFGNDSCPMRNEMNMRNGILSHKDGKCKVAIDPAFNPMEGKKLPIPYKNEVAQEYIFSRIAARFEMGKKFRSRTKQEMKDAEMLVTYYPVDTAKSIFNGVSMFVYPLNFKGEYCQNIYRYGKGVVIVGKYNIPLYLYFFMTEESIIDFDKYLSELKGMFIFQEMDETDKKRDL